MQIEKFTFILSVFLITWLQSSSCAEAHSVISLSDSNSLVSLTSAITLSSSKQSKSLSIFSNVCLSQKLHVIEYLISALRQPYEVSHFNLYAISLNKSGAADRWCWRLFQDHIPFIFSSILQRLDLFQATFEFDKKFREYEAKMQPKLV